MEKSITLSAIKTLAIVIIYCYMLKSVLESLVNWLNKNKRKNNLKVF